MDTLKFPEPWDVSDFEPALHQLKADGYYLFQGQLIDPLDLARRPRHRQGPRTPVCEGICNAERDQRLILANEDRAISQAGAVHGDCPVVRLSAKLPEAGWPPAMGRAVSRAVDQSSIAQQA
jgi:hypothetical protein